MPFRVMICTPSLSRPGGVVNYYTVLRPYFPSSITYRTIGRRGDADSRWQSLRQLARDYTGFVFELRSGRFDLVHLNPSVVPGSILRDAALIVLAKLMRVPVLVFFRGWNHGWAGAFFRFAPFVFPRLFFRADALIVLAREFETTLRDRGYRGPIHLETTVADDDAFVEIDRSGRDSVTLLFLSRLSAGKGVRKTIAAFQHAKRQFPMLRLLVAGDGPERVPTEEMVRHSGTPDVQFLGHVSGAEKAAAFAAADIFVFPTRYGEGMPNAVLEAMACGLPIITRPVGGLRDFFQDGLMGFLTEADDPATLGGLIERLAADADLRRTIGAHNRAYAHDRFAASRVVQRLQAIYAQTLGLSQEAPGRRRGGQGLGWYVSRLRTMSGREILHRVQERVEVGRLRRDLKRADAAPTLTGYRPADYGFCRSVRDVLPDLPWAEAPTGAEAKDLLAGGAPALGHTWRWRESADVWYTAPDTGRRWPGVFFSHVCYRPGNCVGDSRITWEPARLQHLVALGRIFRTAADSDVRQRAADLVRRQLICFNTANPYARGIHYVSTLELGLRILAVCHAADLIRPALAEGPADEASAFWATLACLVDGHAHLIVRRLSLYSSAGNHTIGECAGLIYAARLFPELPEASRWLATALPLMEREADRQILPDGGGLEQAFGYTAQVVDLAGLITRLLAHTGAGTPDRLRAAWLRGCRFLSAFATEPTTLPAVGDWDSGNALSPLLRLSWGQESPPVRRLVTYPQSGYSWFRDDRAPRREVLFDHGPLGMAPNFGHGHADALSVLVRMAGRPLLIDPGTFSYVDPDFRPYFRGTAAHNTVCVDDQDQATPVSPFQWTAPYSARRLMAEEDKLGVRLLAGHDGYRRLGVVHWRAVHILSVPRLIVVWDRLRLSGKHVLSLSWHVAGTVTAAENGVHVTDDTSGARAALRIEGGDIETLTGSIFPNAGWESPEYGIRRPITTLRATRRCDGTHTFITTIAVGSDTLPPPADTAQFDRYREFVA